MNDEMIYEVYIYMKSIYIELRMCYLWNGESTVTFLRKSTENVTTRNLLSRGCQYHPNYS